MKNRLRSASVEDTAELSPEYKQIVDFVTHGWSSVKLEMEQGDVWKYHQDNKQQTKKCKGHYWLLIVCRGHEREVLPGEVQPAAGGLLPVWPGRVVGAPPLPEPHHRPVTAPRGDGQAAQVSTCSTQQGESLACKILHYIWNIYLIHHSKHVTQIVSIEKVWLLFEPLNWLFFRKLRRLERKMARKSDSYPENLAKYSEAFNYKTF